jgi:D-serine deaminase-like pyridoxal phosphate-dependent protein
MPRIGGNIFDGTFALPVATLDEAALHHNLSTMAGYCAGRGVLLAPHGKTTMSPEIVRRQLDLGAWAITAATAWQAAVLASFGAGRIILANQVVDAGSLAVLDRLLAAGVEVHCLVDSAEALRLLTTGVRATERLRVLVELGLPGGRTGLRDDEEALTLAGRVAAGPLTLSGVAAFEGLIDAPTTAATLDLVDALLSRLAGLATRLPVAEPIVTVGGSAYFDRVTAVLAGGPWRVVLRSGCYVTHDAGLYERLSPFGATPREPLRLREALHVWAPVLSVPEPGLALAGLGRRDASTDAGLPVPQLRHSTVRVTAVNDQHAYLDVPACLEVAVGDIIRFGVSHPCTTFDKWRVIPMVSADGTVQELVHTHF